jgi:predicted permease
VTASTVPVLGGDNWGTGVSVQGFQGGPDVDTESRYTLIAPDYFRSLSIPLLQGREFTRADTLKSPRVAIVNEQFAKKFNLGNDVVGKRMGIGNTNVLNIEIVGLVHDAKYSEVKDQVPPVFYRPYPQGAQLNAMSFYLQTSGDPNQLVRSIPSVMTRIDPTLPVEEAQTLPQQVRENITVDRVISILSATFAAVATILAAIGLYGVLAYTVTQRTREIGVRMALGAAPARVRFMVLRHVALMTVIGGAVGLALALGAGRFAESLLFQLNGHDPIIIGTSVVALLCITLAAGLVPALRASRVDPISALRYE